MTENDLQNLNPRNVLNEQEQYNIRFNPKTMKDYAYLGIVWEAYGNRYYYLNLKTGEVVSIYENIGD